ncbi:MAG: septum formation initiator family protein [Deltaproteobacteria bacterium]|nr:septum formation initiator family protein [Deltaproteobacteria bacterium]
MSPASHRWVLRLALAGGLAVGLGYLPYRAYGPSGVGRVHRLEQQLDRLDRGNAAMQEENQRLRGQVKRLTDGRRAIERVARDELGLVRPGDLVFQFE